MSAGSNVEPSPDFLAGGGDMGALIRAYDWSTSPLGSPETWPQALRSALVICLNTPIVSAVHWWPDLRILYNDAYAPALAERHPWALGRPFHEVWAEIWDVLGPQIESVLKTGRGFSTERQLLKMNRRGLTEDTWWIYSFAPLYGNDGTIAGIFVTALDESAKVLAEHRVADEAESQRRMFDGAPGFICTMSGPEHVFDFVNAAHRRLFNSSDWIGKPVREAFPDIARQGFYELLDQVYRTGERVVLHGAPARYRLTPGAAETLIYMDFVYAPIIEGDSVVGIFCEGQDVTDAHAAQAALKDSEGRFRALVNATNNVVYRMSADWREMRTLDGAGFIADTDQPTSDWIDTYIPADERSRVREAIAKAIAAKSMFKLEHKVLRADGGIGWTYSRAIPLLGADGEITEWFGAASDVTDRKRNEARYRTLFESIESGFCVFDMVFDDEGRPIDYVFVEVNPAFAAQTGLTDAVGRRMSELAPGHEQRWYDLYGEVALTGAPLRVEDRAVALGRAYEIYAFRVGEPEQRRVAALFNDVTERKRSESRLHELNRTLENRVAERTTAYHRYRDIVEATTSPICAFDHEFRLIAFNKAHNDEFRRVNGFDTKLGDVFPDLFIPAQQPVMRAFMTRALSGERFTVTEEFGRPDLGQPLWEISYTPLLDESRAVIGAFHLATDISERVRIAADLALAQEQLRQSQKMEAVGQLTGGIAHDFNNLLGGISGSLEMLDKRLAAGRLAGAERYIASAQDAARRAASLTQRLLAFSRRQTLDPKAVDANKLVAGMEDLIRRAVGPSVELEFVQAGNLWMTRADPSQLENSILNLCINARDAMAPDGGRLKIETANRLLDDREARERDLLAGQYVSLCVTDTGAGMPREVIERAFDPFFTTKPLGQGTGLGLSMIYGFVRQSGGQVRIQSEVGKGTTMELYLPRHMGSEIETVETPESAAAGSNDGETVLVIDDEPILRMLALEVLAEAGYKSLEASDGPSGLKILQSNVRIDLLVTDVGLPGGMNGRQVADAARRVRPDLKVLFITGYAENAVVRSGDLEPGMEVMTKPFAINALSNRIRDMIDG